MVETAPRRYFSIATPKRVAREHAYVSHACLDSGRWTGVITLTARVLSPVHVGTGLFEPVGRRLVRVPVLRDGQPVVPGSSIKGACRQVYELLTDSDAPSDRPGPQPSAAAALFGALGHQGRASFDDATADVGTCLTEVRISTPYPPCAAQGRRFYAVRPVPVSSDHAVPALAVPVGARLTCDLRVRNVTEAELGGILRALGVDGFVMRLGAGKYDGYGCVRIDVAAHRLRVRHAWGPGDLVQDADVVRAWRDRCLEAFRPTSCGARALAVLRQRLVPPEAWPVGPASAP